MKELNIEKSDAGQRLDKFLLRYFNKAPKSFIYKMLRKKRIKLNGARAEGNEVISSGDKIEMYLSEETMASFMEEKKINKAERHFGVIYEDENILIVTKPAGLLSHSQSSEDKDTLIDQVLYYLYEKGEYTPDKENTFTPALCNRLDRNTGGIVIAGKNLQAIKAVNSAIADKKIEKFYITMVSGEIRDSKEFFGYHIKDEKTNQVKVLKKEVPGASKIFTKISPVYVKNGFTLLQVKLITGKSHQIRAHLRAMGYPVVGDRKYGDERVNKKIREKYGLNNQFLYAYKIAFKEKDGFLSYLFGKEFQCELPKQLDNIKKAYFDAL